MAVGGMGVFLRSMFAAAVATAFVTVPASAQSVEQFYAGKTINLIVPYAAGGYYDTGARLVARHFGRYIPGKPGIVVQNQPGVGGISLANRFATGSRNDGTELGVLQRALPQYAFVGFQNANFDPLKLTWIGSLSGYETDSYVLTINKSHAANTLDKLRAPGGRTQLGAGRSGSANLLYALIAKDLLNLNVEIVRGYDGNATIFLAQQRGEVDGLFSDLSTLKSANADSWNKHDVVPIVQFGRKARLPELQDVPTARELVSDPEQREFLEFAELPFFIAWPLAGPYGIAADRLKALQEGFLAMAADPVFLEEAHRMSFEVDPVPGPKVSELIAQAAKTKASLRDRFLALVSQ
jgi:tripartite-type tricarboxylate transporter receptor subunit TctC